MKPIIEVTHDEAGGVRPMYIYYSHEPVTKTVDCDDEGSVSLDFDTNGEVVGIEILHPGDDEIALAIETAKKYGLSLSGVFDPGLIAP
jgi:uncharacterized protein YuzE